MELTVGQNSWANITEADAYLDSRIEAEEWFTLSDSGVSGGIFKDSLLISSFYWLLGSNQLNLSVNLTGSIIKNAQIEGALFLLEHYAALNARRSAIGTGVESFKLSKRSEKLGKISIPDHILGMLVSYRVLNSIVELKGEYDV